MGITSFLILSLGVFGAAYSSKCIPETAVCSPYWTQIEPHRNLMESKQELDSWCRKQSLFFRCLDDVLLGIYGNYSNFPINVLVSKMFTEDLCLEGSTSRQRYLDNAACINQMDYEHCTLPEYLEIVAPDSSVPTKCSSTEKTSSCIATTMVIKCGFDAGRVYRYLLKVTKYGKDICGVESSESITCDEAPDSAEDKLSEIYYGLLHRFGSIPEHASAAGLMEDGDSVSHPDESALLETLNKALDAMDYSESNEESKISTLGNEANRSKDESRKRPVIIEQFKGVLFYNYSNKEFEFYWRQPGSFSIDRVTCGHVLSPNVKGVLFECVVQHRSKDPECYSDTMPTTSERITPELIRDIDITIPENSTLDISSKLDLKEFFSEYFRPKNRKPWTHFFAAKLIMETDQLRVLNRNLQLKYPNNKVCLRELRLYDIIGDYDRLAFNWWQCPTLFSDELRHEIYTALYKNSSMRRYDETTFLSVFNEDDKSYVHLYEPFLHAFDKVVCERVDECHPRGRGVFKCSVKRRDLEGCNFCCYYYDQPKCIPQLEPEGTEEEPFFENFNSVEQGSGAPEDSAVYLVDEETSTAESTTFVAGVIAENGDLVSLDLSELQRDFKSESSSNLNLMLVSQNSEESSGSTFLARSGVLNTLDNETPSDDLSVHELDLSNDNIFVLQAMPSAVEFEAAYEIDLED